MHTPNMRGALPLCSPLERALRPTSRGILQGRRSLRPTICEGAKPPLHSPMRGRSAPPPRVTFSPMRKSPKNLQGLRLLESPEGDRAKSVSLFAPAPPAASRNPLDRVSTIKQDRFATLSWWANRSLFFSPSYTGGHTLCCQSVARQLLCGLRAARSCTPFCGEQRAALLGG